MSDIFSNGSRWLRFDCQVDKEFVYSGEENSYSSQYIQKLKDENIGVGVITNLILLSTKQKKKISIYFQELNYL